MRILEFIGLEKKPIEVPRPAPVRVAAEEITDKYMDLLKSLKCNGIHDELDYTHKANKFRRFLAENGICVYDINKVHAYLNKICPWMHQVVWVPLEAHDYCLDTEFRQSDGHSWASHHSSIGWLTAQYSKPVPVPVLMTAQTIKAEYADQVQFYVSDFHRKQINPIHTDPFLLVEYKVMLHRPHLFFVIERWDEPGFRM